MNDTIIIIRYIEAAVDFRIYSLRLMNGCWYFHLKCCRGLDPETETVLDASRLKWLRKLLCSYFHKVCKFGYNWLLKLWPGSGCAVNIAQFGAAYLHTTLTIPAIERYGKNKKKLYASMYFGIQHVT